MKRKIVFGKKEAFILSVIILTIAFVRFAIAYPSAFSRMFGSIFFIILFLCCTAILVISFLLLFVKKWPLHKILLITLGSIGFLSLLINTPGSIPDEAAHIKNSYLWSNRILGISTTPSGQQKSNVYANYDSYIRIEDQNVIGDIVQKDASVTNYMKIMKNFHFFTSSENTKLVKYNLNDDKMSPVGYFPAILGITVARLLNLGCVPMLYLGKLFMLAFYIFGIYWAIKRIPFGKYTLFIISLLPICISLRLLFRMIP